MSTKAHRLPHESSETFRPMLRLAVPVLIEQTLVMLVGFADTGLTGRYLGQDHLAAIGLISYFLWLLPCVFGLVAIGSTAVIARLIGQGDREQASLAVNQSLVAGAILALVTMAVFGWGADAIVGGLQLGPVAGPMASKYLRILVPIIPMIMLEQVGIASLRGAGDTVSGFVVMALVNLVNVSLGFALVTGQGPFPKLGWEGLAIATAAGYGLAGLLVAGLLVKGRAGLRLRLVELRPQTGMIRRVLRVGVPGGMDMIAVVLCHLWFISIINRLGTEAAAAHGLGIRIESLAYLPGTAFQVAAATLAGQYLGAGKPRQAARSVGFACLVGGLIMCGAALLFYGWGRQLALLFLQPSNAHIADMAAPLLRVVAFAMPSLALTMILTGGLRGAGDTRWPLAFTLIGFLCVRIPIAYFFAWDELSVPILGVIPALGLGVIGAWYAMGIDLVLRSLLVARRFLSGRWQHIAV